MVAAVCWLLFVVRCVYACCLVPVDYCLLLVMRCSLSGAVGWCLLCVVCCAVFGVCCCLLMVVGVFSCLFVVACWLLSSLVAVCSVSFVV